MHFRIIRILRRGASVGVLLTLALAPAPASGQGSAPADTAQPIALAAGDVLKIAVYDRPELTGTYPIGVDGTIRVPLVGSLEVAGTDMETVERTLRDRVSDLMDYDVPVTVDIARYRPVFVVGAVARPGEHEYTPGLRVMQAVARAGGLTLVQTDTEITAIDTLRARRRLMAAHLEVQRLTVRLAALDHLLDGVETLSIPHEAQEAADVRVLRELMHDQQALMDTSREQLQSARAFTERQQQQLDEEINALLAEERALTSQARRVAREVQAMQSLRDKGLATSSRLLAQRQMDTTLKADLHRQAAYLSRVRQEKLRLERQLQAVEDEWRQDHLRERAKVAADLAQARADLDTAQEEALALGLAHLDASVETPTLDSARFIISRPGTDGLKNMIAGPAATLRPGDILNVDLPLIRAPGSMHAVGGNSAVGSDAAPPQTIHLEIQK